MKKAFYILAASVVLLAASCGNNAGEANSEGGVDEGPAVLMDLSDMNGLVRENIIDHGLADVSMQNNVLTTEDHLLQMTIASRLGSDVMEYGIDEFIQVNIDGAWYTIPQQLSKRETPLLLDPFDGHVEKSENKREYTVDFSQIGKLPAGKYRFVEKFFWRRLQEEGHSIAYFWVTEPGGERPPESETTGAARMEDMVFLVESPHGARRRVTDEDVFLSMSFDNLSGKPYIAVNAALEMRNGGEWVNVDYQHANLGLIPGWEKSQNLIFLDEPLAAGDYRLRVSMHTMKHDKIEHECEFTVWAHGILPEPVWDVSELELSPHRKIEGSTGVQMHLNNSILNQKNSKLEMVLAADKLYSYGEGCAAEVCLDGNWYSIPFAHGAVIDIGYSISPETEEASCTHSFDPVFSYGVLPAGEYRLIKRFDLVGPDTPSGMPTYLAGEYATAEFTVEETMIWREE